MNYGLPKLPGYNFNDVTRNRYHVSQKCKVRNGYRNFVETDGLGIGNKPLDVDSVGYLDIDKTTRLDPLLIYGRAKSEYTPKFIPHYAVYGNKCLTFRAYYKQYLPLSPNEDFLVHYVNIHYFLEDDTITVIEPKIPNSGFLEGRIIRRRRIEKPNSYKFWHWKDLNIDMDINLQGIIFHTFSCDRFTKEFMRSQGIDINCDDTFLENSPMEEIEPKYHLFKRPPSGTVENPYRKKYAGRDDVLNFLCIWENDLLEKREFVLSYYVEDDTITIKELLKRNDGRDPFSKLLRKTKLPKHEDDFFHSILEDNDDMIEYYGAEDMIIGNSINVFGRKFLIVNCDTMTRYFYKTILNIEQPNEIDWKNIENKNRENPMEDEIKKYNYRMAKQTIKYPKDELKYILNANKYLRYSADMISSHPEDYGRKFIFSYALADDTTKIVELKQPNFGIAGGTFLSRQKILKPNSNDEEYYTAVDFYIGAIINVYKHIFRITGSDLYVLNYIEQKRDEFPISVYENLKEYALKQGFIKSSDSSDLIGKIDENNSCYVKQLEKNETYKIQHDIDPDAPTVECRFPIAVQGQLQNKQCTHSKGFDLDIRDSIYGEKNKTKTDYKIDYNSDISNYIPEKENKIECPITGEPGMGTHSKKMVTFAV